MKPTEEGHYWVRQNSPNHTTGELRKGCEEIVYVALTLPPRCRKYDAPKVLVVFGRGWSERLDKVPDFWQWGQKIENDLPIFLEQQEF